MPKGSTIWLLAALAIVGPLMVIRKAWALPAAGQPYAADIAAAEAANGIPSGLLGRLLQQESAFRPDVINGTVTSSAGAVGIAQLIPAYYPNVDPTNPQESIDAAAASLRAYRDRFGSWDKALAAYNWGPGNLERAIAQYGSGWLLAAPTETQNYVNQITQDVPA